jgi:hypothetical protein
MARDRLLGVRLIAAYLFLKATALIVAEAVVHSRSDLQPEADEFISYFAINLGASLRHQSALLTAFLDVSVGLGIWFLRRWARTVIVLTNSYGLCRITIGSAILMNLDRRFLTSQISSPYFAISVVAAILILFYLLDTDVKRAFGVRE